MSILSSNLHDLMHPYQNSKHIFADVFTWDRKTDSPIYMESQVTPNSERTELENYTS